MKKFVNSVIMWSIGLIISSFYIIDVYSLMLDDDQVRQYVDSSKIGLSFEGNKTTADHFKLLERDGDWLLIGARDVVYNVSMKNFSAQKSIFWPARGEDVELCIMKGKSKEDCHNYVRVLARDNETGVLVCGTNAYRPYCRHYVLSNDGLFSVVSEFPASGIAPYDPSHNSTAYYFAERNEIYAGTVADFSGTDALISRRQIAQPEDLGLRTERNDMKCLNEPNFVFSFADKDHVYLWFREGAVEYMNCGKAVYSRVGRVCKNDRGGPRANSDTWTTFLKARLNCSLPGDYPFYFNEIEATSSIVSGTYSNSKSSSSELVYAVFNTPYSAIHASAVCAFSMDDIRKIFAQSPFKSQSSPNSNWLPIFRSQVPQPRPGDCDTDSRQLSEEAATFVKKNSLLDDAVPNFFSSPLIVQTGRRRFTHITVDAQVTPVGNGRKYDVVFVGTDDGHVVKLVNLADDGRTKTVVIETIRVFSDSSSIKNMLIYRPTAKNDSSDSTMDPQEARLIVVSDEEIRSLPVHNCYKATTCSSCVRLQDPYCAWEMDSKKCIGVSTGEWSNGKFVQNLVHGVSKICPIDLDTQVPQVTDTEPSINPVSINDIKESIDGQFSSNFTNATASSAPCKCSGDNYARKPGGQSRHITLVDGSLTNELGNDKDSVVTLEKISDQPSVKNIYTAESLAVAVVVTMLVSLILGIAAGLRLSKTDVMTKFSKKKFGSSKKHRPEITTTTTTTTTTTPSSKNQIIYANGGCKINGVAGVRTSTANSVSQPIKAFDYDTSSPMPLNVSINSDSSRKQFDNNCNDDVGVEVKLGDDSMDSSIFNSATTLPKDYKVKKTYL